jgi:ATP-dependent DNA ligase
MTGIFASKLERGLCLAVWARTTSDYSKAFTRPSLRCRSIAQVLDGEAVVMRPDNSFDFEALRSRQGQAEAILVAYDIIEADDQDVRPEPLEERRKRLAKAAIPRDQADGRRHSTQQSDHRRRGRHLPLCVAGWT